MMITKLSKQMPARNSRPMKMLCGLPRQSIKPVKRGGLYRYLKYYPNCNQAKCNIRIVEEHFYLVQTTSLIVYHILQPYSKALDVIWKGGVCFLHRGWCTEGLVKSGVAPWKDRGAGIKVNTKLWVSILLKETVVEKQGQSFQFFKKKHELCIQINKKNMFLCCLIAYIYQRYNYMVLISNSKQNSQKVGIM